MSNNTTQNDLFILQPLMSPENKQMPLITIYEMYASGRLRLPHYQRAFVWDNHQIKEWAESILSQDAIGVIVTYQITGEKSSDYPIFLADGRQRLEATGHILQSPHKFDLSFGSQQIRAYVEAFTVTVQHRQYQTHGHAFYAFQHLNLGTRVNPAEYYKGELTQNEGGTKVYSQAVKVMNDASNRIIRKTKLNHDQVCKLDRDSLALYYQYTSNSDTTRYWNVARSRINPSDMGVEQLIAELIATFSKDQLDQSLKSFEKYLDEQTALIQDTMLKVRGPGHAMSPTLYRHLLHLAIWRRNTSRPVSFQQEYTRTVLEAANGLNADVRLPNKKHYVTLKLDSLHGLPAICEAFGIAYEAPRRSRKSKPTAPGWDNSHYEPFSEYGEGETFPEPGPINKARGAKSVIQAEFDFSGDEFEEEDDEL